MEHSSILIPLASSQRNLYDIHLLLCVQYYTLDDGQKISPKHVEFYSKNKFGELVHLVGFIIRIYHDARSSEYQILFTDFNVRKLSNFRIFIAVVSYRNCGNNVLHIFN
jgi:hypothetical protein